MAPQTIRQAIDSIAAEYQGGEIAWLEKTNPAALSQLDVLERNLGVPVIEARLTAYVATWKFWIRSYKCFISTKKTR
jgi:hypothetical protein